MNGEIQGQIQKFLYCLSNEDFANADKHIQKTIEMKVKNIFDKEYERLKSESNTQRKG